jgi:hypothetical protein
MRAFNMLRQTKLTSRATGTAVVNYTSKYKLTEGNDLTKKWIARIQNKAKDTQAQEAFGKLSSLIDFYNKPVEPVKEVKQS